MMRFRASLLLFFLPAAALADEGAGAWPVDFPVTWMENRPSFSLLVQPDVRTAYITRGKVVEDRPMASVLTRGQVDLWEFGSLGVHSWDKSSLCDRRTDVCRRAFNETDAGVYWHYDYSFNDDWALSSEFVKYWVMLNGYTKQYRDKKSDATLNEWRVIQSLKNPYLTPFYLMRRCVHPKEWMYIRAGVMRKFPLGGGFALTPQWYAENGNERLFENRYGPRQGGGKYHSGMQASNFVLELSWTANDHLSFFVGVQQFDIVSKDARRSTKASSSRCARSDLTVGTAGCRIKF